MKQYTNEGLKQALLAERDKNYDCEDYRFNSRAVNRVFKKALKDLCTVNNLELISYNAGYFEGSAFIKRTDGRLVYVSVSDVRHWPDFATNILYRTCKHDKDFSGGANRYSDWEGLGKAILSMQSNEWERSKW